jgi:hypothetical protein
MHGHARREAAAWRGSGVHGHRSAGGSPRAKWEQFPASFSNNTGAGVNTGLPQHAYAEWARKAEWSAVGAQGGTTLTAHPQRGGGVLACSRPPDDARQQLFGVLNNNPRFASNPERSEKMRLQDGNLGRRYHRTEDGSPDIWCAPRDSRARLPHAPPARCRLLLA